MEKCSFCFKQQDEVFMLIQSQKKPTVFICDECVRHHKVELAASGGKIKKLTDNN